MSHITTLTSVLNSAAYWWIIPSWQALVTIRVKLRRMLRTWRDTRVFLLPDLASTPRITTEKRM